MTLPVDQLYRTTVAVRDLGAAAREYADFYGITRWRVRNDRGSVSADGANASGGLCFRLIEDTSAAPGVRSICVTRVAPSALPRLREELEQLGAPVAGVSIEGDGVESVMFDTTSLLGGFAIEVIVSEHESWDERLRYDEVWQLDSVVTRPSSLDFVRETPGLNHFGVVVPDLLAVLPNYARLFGARRWRGYHWHTGEGSLDEATYMGAQVEHGFSTARGDVGRDRFGKGFGFEIVQPDFGPTHFADFLHARAGAPGIHHLSLNLRMKDAYEWVEFQRWMETLGPQCMTGWLRDHSAMYIYSDLSARIGHVVESGIRRQRGHEPDRWYEFTEDGSLLS